MLRLMSSAGCRFGWPWRRLALRRLALRRLAPSLVAVEAAVGIVAGAGGAW